MRFIEVGISTVRNYNSRRLRDLKELDEAIIVCFQSEKLGVLLAHETFLKLQAAYDELSKMRRNTSNRGSGTLG